MNREQIFEVWAPPGGRWSPWVKPVLFAWMDKFSPPAYLSRISMEGVDTWAASIPAGTALVIDLPGPESIQVAMMPVFSGYRPVPLYNALPGPAPDDYDTPSSVRPAVETQPIAFALRDAVLELMGRNFHPEAPPAFLLDANRRGPGFVSEFIDYDNRSVSFTTDFPSANFLLAHGIRNALLIQRQGRQPQPDLAHTLRRWQDGGVKLFLTELYATDQSPLVPMIVEKPSMFGVIWYRAKMMMGLERHSLGGFGGILEEESSGGWSVG